MGTAPLKRQITVMMFYLIAVSALAAAIGNVLPPTKMLGLPAGALSFVMFVSSYLGGFGLGALIAGAGQLIGCALQLVLYKLSPLDRQKPVLVEVAVGSFSFALGTALSGWYLWSYLHPA